MSGRSPLSAAGTYFHLSNKRLERVSNHVVLGSANRQSLRPPSAKEGIRRRIPRLAPSRTREAAVLIPPTAVQLRSAVPLAVIELAQA